MYTQEGFNKLNVKAKIIEALGDKITSDMVVDMIASGVIWNANASELLPMIDKDILQEAADKLAQQQIVYINGNSQYNFDCTMYYCLGGESTPAEKLLKYITTGNQHETGTNYISARVLPLVSVANNDNWWKEFYAGLGKKSISINRYQLTDAFIYTSTKVLGVALIAYYEQMKNDDQESFTILAEALGRKYSNAEYAEQKTDILLEVSKLFEAYPELYKTHPELLYPFVSAYFDTSLNYVGRAGIRSFTALRKCEGEAKRLGARLEELHTFGDVSKLRTKIPVAYNIWKLIDVNLSNSVRKQVVEQYIKSQW